MKTHHFLLALLATFLPLAQSCSNEELAVPDQSKETTLTLKLTSKDVFSFAQSRADWNDKYPAVFNEGNITNVILAVYSTSIASFQSLSGTDLTNAQNQKPELFDLTVGTPETVDGKKVYTTNTFKMALNPEETYYFLVIANPPSGMSATTLKDYSITQIADYTISRTQLCVEGDNVQLNDKFVMTSDVERSFSPTASQLAGTESIDITNGQPVLVERLACRIDLAFGNPEFDGNNAVATSPIYYDGDGNPIKFYVDDNGFGYPEEGKTIAKIVLPVFNHDEYVNKGIFVPTHDTYTVTSVELVDIRTDKEYMIQRTRNNGKNNYFAYENWSYANGVIYANSTTVNPGINTDSLSEHFATESYTLSGFIKKNNSLYTSTINGTYFYTLGYFLENTNKYTESDSQTDHEKKKYKKTQLKVYGEYHKVGDLASPGDKEFKNMNLSFYIRHCDPKGKQVNMDKATPYGTGRNCIYRLYMDKVFSDGDRVYVTWYYDSENNGYYDPVRGVDGAAIVRDIDESPGSSTTVND